MTSLRQFYPVLAGGVLLCLLVAPASAQPETSIRQLEERILELQKQDAKRQEEVEALRRQIEALRSTAQEKNEPETTGSNTPAAASGDAALDQALATAGLSTDSIVRPEIASRQWGGLNFRLIDISIDSLIAVGGSSERGESLRNIQGGGHDPRKRGFTVQNVELSLMAAVDPYLDGEVHLIYFIDPESNESTFELEEAFLTTKCLPFGLQLEMGQFFTEFGRINPRHPHEWDFLDQPVVNSRFFGPDGLRGPGARLGWLTPLPFFSEIHVGVQNAGGETAASFLANDEFFEERPIDGRPFADQDVRSLKDLIYLVRWDNGFELSPTVNLGLGGSFLYGPNATGTDGRTIIWGADVRARWQPVANQRGYPFVEVQAEVMGRDYFADSATDEGDQADPTDDVFFPRDTLQDWGLYTQVLCGFLPGWSAGIRWEYATGNSAFGDRSADPFRDNRQRFSPLVTWVPTEYSRFRLQYNYDETDHLMDSTAHSVWFGVEFLFGAHPAHKL